MKNILNIYLFLYQVGEQKSSAKLTVEKGTGVEKPHPKQEQPPKIEIDETLINQTIEMNKQWRVDARYKGIPKPEISWMKNGQSITTTERCVINTDHATSTIVIQSVEHTDTGVYKVSATNKLATESRELKLQVIGNVYISIYYIFFRKKNILNVYFKIQ